MKESTDYLDLKLELDYSYALGGLKPYFDALSEGRALASKCPECGTISFPPRLICANDQTETQWMELDGTGVIVESTSGQDANGEDVCFALIQMDGADNRCLGRLVGGDSDVGDRVRLQAATSNGVHPAQNAVFVPIN